MPVVFTPSVFFSFPFLIFFNHILRACRVGPFACKRELWARSTPTVISCRTWGGKSSGDVPTKAWQQNPALCALISSWAWCELWRTSQNNYRQYLHVRFYSTHPQMVSLRRMYALLFSQTGSGLLVCTRKETNYIFIYDRFMSSFYFMNRRAVIPVTEGLFLANQ
jgi:hypothetical protein